MRRSLDAEVPTEITMPARPDAIPGLLDFVSTQARDMAFDEKRVGQIGLALKEALDNILRFACPTGDEEIRISCDAHEMGALLVNIKDTGVPFNMLVLSAFPEIVGDSAASQEIPSTKIMKKFVKDIEYRRDGDNKTNILAWVVFG
jgi:anti-sigma regulatory factor (Ser/Thr protein kinase)